MKSWILAAIALSLAGTASGQPAADGLHLIDLTGEFDRTWQTTQYLPDDRRVKEFQARFAKILPGFYEADRVKSFIPRDRYHALILKGLKEYPDRKAGIQRVSREFGALIAHAQREFEAEFGPMTGYPAVYLVHSVGEFDGATRKLPEGTRLLFGADMVDRLYKDVPIQPFFHHELFHLMHDRTFPECEKIWCNLWAEGLAAYVSAKLNSGADDVALGFTIPAPLRPAVEAHRVEAVCAVVARIESEKGEDYAPLFTGGAQPLSANLPPRFGYYVGYLVAQKLGRTRKLKQLAALDAQQARPLIKDALAGMASCPPGQSDTVNERG